MFFSFVSPYVEDQRFANAANLYPCGYCPQLQEPIAGSVEEWKMISAEK